MSTMRRQGAAVGLALGGVLSLPALVVMGLVTRDVAETVSAWLWVGVPLSAAMAALGAVAAGRAPRAGRRPGASLSGR